MVRVSSTIAGICLDDACGYACIRYGFIGSVVPAMIGSPYKTEIASPAYFFSNS